MANSKLARSAARRNYLGVEVQSVLEKARDVVDDDSKGANKHLQTGLSHRTNSYRLKRLADRHVTVECDENRYPDRPHLTDVHQWPNIYLTIHIHCCHRCCHIVTPYILLVVTNIRPYLRGK